jgi:hypothetical protein
VVKIASPPPASMGTLNFLLPDGSFSFTPKAFLAKGTKVKFTYFINDPDGNSNVATVTITIV